MKAVAMGTTGDASGTDLSAANKDKVLNRPLHFVMDSVCFCTT